MVYCLFRGSCEPRPKDFENSYRCCNSCDNKKCTNRCKDDCSKCGYSTDINWVLSQKKVFFPDTPKEVNTKPIKNSKKENFEALMEEVRKRKELSKVNNLPKEVDREALKKEARRRRRLARKNKLKK